MDESEFAAEVECYNTEKNTLTLIGSYHNSNLEVTLMESYPYPNLEVTLTLIWKLP